MKKFVATLAAGIVFAGATVTTASAQEHEVQTGESLWKIANKYGTSIDELIEINELKSTVIYPKQIIQIDEAEENETAKDSHKVQAGDTLGKIAKQYDVTVEELKDWNNLQSDVIYVGGVLALYGEQSESAPQEEVSAELVSQETEQPAEQPKEEPVETTQVEQESQSEEGNTEEKAEGKTISVTATAYTADCAGCSGVTATGINLRNDRNAKVIAVDPNVIPLGSKVYVDGYGYATAGDTGGAIKGNKIDLHMATKQEAMNWGNRTVNVTIVD